ncbi:hypothetical protein TrST_g11234 [Triparma strigata]|uniref:Structural maintenance of chromosomes protein 5 n=1 Tax=Triparma strigata TaxID=1606541 RepID=A0A9W7EM14_9STRA|nr:hypothetical protein TrST_g11234 [Triparma strigata]
MSFKHGSISSIKLSNFLTYNSCTIRPGPRLNVVIGPNGSGKSSILCAICLGLGGSPGLLGRADDVREFISHECDEGFIEIELIDTTGGRGDVIRRTLVRDEKGGARGVHGSFTVNGNAKPQKFVAELVLSKYKINVSNLLSFLPQDKVGSFSSYNPNQLLVETMKALSSKHLFDVYTQLCSMELESKDTGRQTETISERLTQLKSEREGLQRSREQIEARKKAVEQVEVLEKKALWLGFEDLRCKTVELKERREAAKKKLDEATTNLPALERAKETIEGTLQGLLKKAEKKEKEYKNSKKDYEKTYAKAAKLKEEIEDCEDEFTTVEEDAEKADKKAKDMEEKVKRLEKELKTAKKGAEDVDEKLPKVQAEYKSLADVQFRLQSQKDALEQQFHDASRAVERVKLHISKIRNQKFQRRNSIYRHQPHIKKICDWIDNNADKFRKKVFGPVGACIDARNDDVAKYVDQHVANAILQAFVVQTQQDYDFLYKEVREKRGIPINIELVEDGGKKPNREYSAKRMEGLKKDYGIVGFLDQFYDAEPVVKRVLENHSKTHSVLVGSDRTSNELDRPNSDLMEMLTQREGGNGQPRSACVCFPTAQGHYRYTANISRYTQKTNLSILEVNQSPKYVSRGVTKAEMEKVEAKKAEVDEKYDQISAEITDINNKHKESRQEGLAKRAEVKSLQDRKKAVGEKESRLRQAEKKLEEARAGAAVDTEKEKKRISDKAVKKVSGSLGLAHRAAQLWAEVINDTMLNAGMRCTAADMSREKLRLEDMIEEENRKGSSLKEDYIEAKSLFSQSKDKLKELKARAEAEAPLVDEEGNDLPLKAKLETLPDSLAEVNATLDDCKAAIANIHDDPHVIAEYERKEKEIEKLSEQLKDQDEMKSAKAAEIDALSQGFVSRLKNYITTVDGLFSTYMEELGCAGGVALWHGDGGFENPDRSKNESFCFKDWGIHIKVKYRQANSLQVLSAHIHSGGERSVATIMFLMALQNELVSPFRCVDEINQGMDEIFERKVFARVVENSCGPPKKQNDPTSHTGQYFLITPKLLPNLDDMENEATTILFIINGPYNGLANYGFNDWLKSRKRLGPDWKDELDGEVTDEDEEEEKENDRSGGAKKQKKKQKKRAKVVQEQEEGSEEEFVEESMEL